MALSDTRKNFYVALVVLAIFALMLVWSAHIPQPRGREFPTLVAWTGLVLGFLDVVAHTDTGVGRLIAMALSGTAHVAEEGSRYGIRKEVLSILWVVLATAAMILGGFLVGIPVYVFFYLLLHGRKSVRFSVLTALFTTLAIWLSFEVLLEYDLYTGILFAG